MTSITEAELEALGYGLDTVAILESVDAFDRFRAELADGEEGPPALRDDLLELHRLAQALRDHSTVERVSEFFDLASDLEFQVGELMEMLGGIHTTLSAITALSPESLSYGD